MIEIFGRLGIALGLGLLIGLQRERTDARLAGFRTFPLVTLFGALSGLLAESYGGWIVAGGQHRVWRPGTLCGRRAVRFDRHGRHHAFDRAIGEHGRGGAGNGWRLILVAAMSNLAFKAGIVALVGGRPVLGRVGVGFGVAGAVGAGLLFAG